MVKRIKKRQVFYRLEKLEGVTELPSTATDFVEMTNPQSSIEQQEVVVDVASSTLSKPKSIPGARRGRLSGGVYVRPETSVARHASQPDESWITLLAACGVQRAATGVPYLKVGTNTDAVVLRGGEQLKGVTSNATAWVLRPVAPNAPGVKVYVYGVNGTFLAGEDINTQYPLGDPGGPPGAPAAFNLDATTPTGADGKRLVPTSLTLSRISVTGGWTGTPILGEVIRSAGGAIGTLVIDNSGVVSDRHLVIEPLEAAVPFVNGEVVAGLSSLAFLTTASPVAQAQVYTPSLTLQDRIDGILKVFKGARGNAQLVAEVGSPIRWDFSFQSGVAGFDDVPLAGDAASPSESIIRLVDGVIDVDGLHFPLATLGLDLQNELAYRPDGNAVDGQLSVQIVDRDPIWTIDPEQPQTKAYNWYSRWESATSIRALVQAGSAIGSRFALISRNLQCVSLTDGDRDSFLTAEVQLKARKVAAAGDDEFEVCLW